MRAAIWILVTVMPMVALGEWRPSPWRETVSEWESRQPLPTCEERRVAIVGDSIMMHKDFAGYLHDRWVQFGDWYEWDDRFDGDAWPDIQVQGFFRKGGGVSLINELMWDALSPGGFRPTHVVISGGINDCAMVGHSPEKNAEYVIQALDAMVHHVLDSGAKPVLMQHTPWKGSKYDKKGRGWECSQIVNQWIWGEQLMAEGSRAQVIWTGSLGSCQHSTSSGGECACEYTFPGETQDWCGDVHVLDPYIDAGDGLHLKWMGQCELAANIHSYLEW
jgi:hypothetical protein